MQDKVHKLVVSVVGLLLSVVMIAMATFAWFSISTAPEINGVSMTVASVDGFLPFMMSLDGETWTSQLDITELFEEANVLRPISTYDGETWFVALTDAFGSVNTFLEIDDSSIGNYANTGSEESNYFVYADIYVTSFNTSDDEFEIRLSNPSDEDNIQDSETNYGTFVLYEPTKDSDGNISVNDTMAAIRVGFQFYSEADAGEFVEEDTFYIYEPNGNMRAGTFTEYLESYTDTTSLGYIYTGENSSYTVDAYKDYDVKDTTYKWTSVPVVADTALGYTLIEVGSETVEELETTLSVDIDVSKDVTLIRQETSAWDQEELKSSSTYDSTDIATIGDFYEDTPVMSTIEVGEVKMIRVYFWIEGQDIDCWNQIAGGNIFANLEFTGEATNS